MDSGSKNVLGVILARGGSKSIPAKNISPCAGKPLLFYTVMAAQNARLISRLIISTDDEERKNWARLVLHASSRFIVANVGSSSYRLRSIAESFGESKAKVFETLQEIYDLENGEGGE